MRVPPPVLAVVFLVVVGAGLGWALLAGPDRPVDPDLGPAVQVRLTTPTADPTASSTPGRATTGGSSDRPSAPQPTAHSSLGAKVPGARTVPRHAPAPAGDDDDDRDDGADQPDIDDDD